MMDHREALAFGLLLASALLCSLYAVCVKSSANRLVFFSCKTLILLPVAVIAAFFAPLPSLVTTGHLLLTTLFYNLMLMFLSKAYDEADVSVAAPVMAAIRVITVCLFSATLLAERISPLHAGAIGVIILAILGRINFRKFNEGHLSLAGLKFCLLTGLFSGAQIFNDILGIRSAVNPFTWIVWESFIALPTLFYGLYVYKREIFTLMAKEKGRIILADIFDCSSYYLFLFVAQGLKVLYALPVYNMTIVFTVILGIFALKERAEPRRIIAAILITAGVVILNIK